ncbi:MAG: EVE domain-containing protein [Gammaproteobacteria bacterium]|nr:EVE domain-containing protein [Gammaproteobacteria bacterium]
MAYWLMKSEPEAFGIDALKARPRQIEPWDGVRNYLARNYMRDRMNVGDLAFMYHSNCEEPGIYGIMEIATPAYPDPSQFDRKSKHYDAAARPEEPRWYLVDVRYKRHLARPVPLANLRAQTERLKGFKLLAPGSRLSVMPVSPEHWEFILALEGTGSMR